MKKLTKILALALALAMMLGMTSMAADVPSKLVINDDFSNDVNFDGFKTNSTLAAVDPATGFFTAAMANRSESDKGTLKYNRFYIGEQYSVSTNNGQTVLSETGMNKANVGFGYAPDTAFTETRSINDKVALVAQIGWKTTGASTATTLDWASHHILYKNASGAEAAGALLGISRGYRHPRGYDKNNDPYSFGVGEFVFVAPNSTVDALARSSSTYKNITKTGDDITLQYVVRALNQIHPYVVDQDELVYEGDPSDKDYESNKVKYEQYSLAFISSIDRTFSNDSAHWTPYLGGQEVQAFWFANSDFAKGDYHDFMLYEVSLDPKDLYVENKTGNTGKLPSDSFDVIISQPVSVNEHGSFASDKSGGYDETNGQIELSDWLTVVANGDTANPLVYGTDYTLKVSEKIEKGAVKGVISVVPLKKWALGTTYTVTVPGGHLVSVSRMTTAKDADAVATFETMTAPEVTFKAYEGLQEGTTELLDYAGKTVYVKATAENTNDISFDGKIIIGIYDASGTLVKYASATRSLAATNGNATFGASFKLAAGQTIRAEFK